MSNNLNEKIKSRLKEIKPKSRWEFITYDLIKDLVLAGLIVLAILVLGTIIYIIRQYNPWQNLPEGIRYEWQAIQSLPWEMILLSVLLVTLIAIGAKKINNFYRINPIFIFSTIVLLIFCGYALAENLGINKKISETPMAKNIYQKHGKIILTGHGVVMTGQVSSVKVPKLIVIDPKNKTWQIITNSKTHIISPDQIEPYDYVTINGTKIDDNSIEAFMIREMDESWRGFLKEIKKAHFMQCPGCTK